MITKLESIPLSAMWSRDRLLARYEEIGASAFDRGYRQIAITEGALTFRNFAKCIVIGVPPIAQWHFSGVDLSGKERAGNVICTIGIDGAGNMWPVDVRNGAWSSPETAEQIYDVYNTYKPAVIHVENNAYQSSIIDWMTQKGYGKVPIVAWTTGRNKSDAQIGLPSLDVQFERGRWKFYVPDHKIGCRCAWCQLVREFKTHPSNDLSDHVMALWFAERAASMYGIKRSAFTDDKDTGTGMRSVMSAKF